MHKQIHRILLITTALIIGSFAAASDDPAHERHELMEGVRDAAKLIGGMLRGKTEFDQATTMDSLSTFADAAARLGDLFPEGSQGGEAAPAIWDDREGFEKAIEKFRATTAVAIAANPDSLEAAGPVLKPVLGSCKNCHDSYRVEDD
jgi:cytochrome c556